MKKNNKTKFCSIILIIILSNLFSANSYSQYFGTNKVKYQNFDFKTLKTNYFEINYYPEEQEAVYDAAYMLERWNERYSKIFGNHITKGQPIILYANHADFQQTNVVGEQISQGTGGVTEGLKNRITLPFTGIYHENDHVLGHELVHAFQYELLLKNQTTQNRAASIPLWFIEGMAEYLSTGKVDPFTAMWMRDAVLNKDIPSIKEVSSNYKYFPYRYGQAIWAFIGGTFGDDMVGRFFKAAIDSGYDDAYKYTFKMNADSISKLWQQSMKQTYESQIIGKTNPDSIGEKILDKEQGFNLSPVISPDGNKMALFTKGDIFTLDLYIADAHNGKLIKKIASSASDRHFDALRFINSSGTWSPDGKKIAFVIIVNGDDEFAIADAESGDIEREIKVPDIDEISFLSWSPDGNKIALAGTYGGINDLVVYDLKTNQSEKLTNDKYTELHPTWSPDGKSIAFATDRGPDTDFKKYKFGTMDLGIIDVETKQIKLISQKEGTKHINPQYSPDGKSIYFIGNPDGFNDIYRYAVNENKFYRITNVATGISGLTDLSPAISISKSGRMIFSVYYKNDYKIHAMEIGTSMQGTSVSITDSLYHYNSILPPGLERSNEIVDRYLNDPSTGLPDTNNFKSTDYSASLKLLSLGQPYVGVGVDRFGTAVGGGVSMLFGDILGDHMLGAVVQASGSFQDIGGQVVYQNLTGRFNWGIAASHIPYLSGYADYGYDTVSYQGNLYLAGVSSIIRQRTFWNEISGMAQYPFSTNRRVEFSLGYSRLSYSLEQQIVKDIGGQIISNETKEYPTPSPLNMITSSIAYVGDYTFFGFTSPVSGSRYRFEVQPTLGGINLASFLGDYRQYIFFNPFTIAFRAFHYGRYFGDAEDSRLAPLYLGDDSWVRGYNINSFDPTESISQNGRVPELDRLIGSKIAVANIEFRTPIFGNEQFGIINFPYLPTELVLFADAGVAWTKEEKPIIKYARQSSDRTPVVSTGIAARINLFGYIIGQVYYAFPFQRNIHRGVWGFLIQPGW